MSDLFGTPVLHAHKGWRGRAVHRHRQFRCDGVWVLREDAHRPSWHLADSLRTDRARDTWERWNPHYIGGTPPAPRGVFGIGVLHPISGRAGNVISAQHRFGADGVWVWWSSGSKSPSWHPVAALEAHATPYTMNVDPTDLAAQIRQAELDGAIA